MHRLILSVLLMSALGCSYPLPKGYVQAPTPYNAKYRAVSADGSALMLSTESNPDNGDLAYWEKAIQTRLTEIGGYKLDNRREIANDHGLKGTEMTFSINQDGIDYVYMVSLFIRGRTIYIFEAAGRKDTFAPDIPEIQKSIAAWPL